MNNRTSEKFKELQINYKNLQRQKFDNQRDVDANRQAINVARMEIKNFGMNKVLKNLRMDNQAELKKLPQLDLKIRNRERDLIQLRSEKAHLKIRRSRTADKINWLETKIIKNRFKMERKSFHNEELPFPDEWITKYDHVFKNTNYNIREMKDLLTMKTRLIPEHVVDKVETYKVFYQSLLNQDKLG
jgi:hypothetical protein